MLRRLLDDDGLLHDGAVRRQIDDGVIIGEHLVKKEMKRKRERENAVENAVFLL